MKRTIYIRGPPLTRGHNMLTAKSTRTRKICSHINDICSPISYGARPHNGGGSRGRWRPHFLFPPRCFVQLSIFSYLTPSPPRRAAQRGSPGFPGAPCPWAGSFVGMASSVLSGSGLSRGIALELDIEESSRSGGGSSSNPAGAQCCRRSSQNPSKPRRCGRCGSYVVVRLPRRCRNNTVCNVEGDIKMSLDSPRRDSDPSIGLETKSIRHQKLVVLRPILALLLK